jgi:uncharacterized protein
MLACLIFCLCAGLGLSARVKAQCYPGLGDCTTEKKALLAPPQTGDAVPPSFNCQGNLAPDEQAVCRNSLLAQLDVQLAQLYAVLQSRLNQQDGNRLRDSQRAWLKRRAACQEDEKCIEDRYLSRIAEIKAWGG